MALSKVTYVDGKTIITAANLNAIQDEIISQESRKAEKTATVSNVTYDETTGKFRKTINGTTSDIITADSSPTSGSKRPVQSGGVYTALTGKVPISRTVNGKALSSDITLAASDVGAVPTSRTVNGKALSDNITLASGDIGDDSGAGGSTVKASLAALKGSLNTEVTARRTADNNIQGLITAYVETGTTASRAYGKGQIIEVDGRLYTVIQPIASGAAFTVGTNIESTTVGTEFTKFVLVESTLTFNNGAAFFYDGHIKANSKLMAGLSYLTPGTTSGVPRLYFVTVQPNIDGRAVVYIRNADGSIPPTIELTVYLIVSNQV